MLAPVAEAQEVQQLVRATGPGLGVEAGIDRRHLDILACARGRDEIVLLEDEAEGAPAQGCALFRIQGAHVLPGEPITAAGWAVEAAQDVHEGRLARARSPDDGDQLAHLDGERDSPQHLDPALARAIGLAHAHKLNQRRTDG
jgi:hypothetical protein